MTPRDLESACSPPTIPHIEGERNPLKRFAASLASATPFARPHYYRDNFADLMGGGLAADLRLSHCGEMVPRGPRCTRLAPFRVAFVGPRAAGPFSTTSLAMSHDLMALIDRAGWLAR
jgi:hypothetical protein